MCIVNLVWGQDYEGRMYRRGGAAIGRRITQAEAQKIEQYHGESQLGSDPCRAIWSGDQLRLPVDRLVFGGQVFDNLFQRHQIKLYPEQYRMIFQ